MHGRGFFMPIAAPGVHRSEIIFAWLGTASRLVRYGMMRKKPRLYKAMRKLPLILAAGAGAITLHACSRAEAEPTPDPAQVQAYLSQIEAEEALISGEAKPKQAQERTIRNLVEGAVVRAPSDAAINRLETVVVRKL